MVIIWSETVHSSPVVDQKWYIIGLAFGPRVGGVCTRLIKKYQRYATRSTRPKGGRNAGGISFNLVDRVAVYGI